MNPRKVLQVAIREFLSTAATKAFLISVLIVPLVALVMILVLPRIINAKPPAVEGQVLVYDPSGRLVATLSEELSPEAFVERNERLRRQIREAVGESVPGPLLEQAERQGALDQVLGQVPRLEVAELPGPEELERARQALRDRERSRVLAVVRIDDNAVEPAEDGTFGAYALYLREGVDDRITEQLERAIERAIVDARVALRGLDADELRVLMRVRGERTVTVTDKGERESNEAIKAILPMAFFMLLWIPVITGGQYLMTTTIEEKSSRVVEVLLSAVSPLELMTGKILGQMAVGLLLLAVYGGLGVGALSAFALLGLLDLGLLVYLAIFFVITYFVIASLMGAIGAAVSELREAQALLGPVMIVLMIPLMLWFWIMREPDSTFAVATSFIPPVNTFVMMLRLTSSAPPPAWQVWLSILVGVGAMFASLWAAAKIFRIGLLLHGKPPTFRTLIAWIRMA
ncbi:MAG: hypothetical protein Kow0062_11650 [Acidobacteriota bacterium]